MKKKNVFRLKMILALKTSMSVGKVSMHKTSFYEHLSVSIHSFEPKDDEFESKKLNQILFALVYYLSMPFFFWYQYQSPDLSSFTINKNFRSHCHFLSNGINVVFVINVISTINVVTITNLSIFVRNFVEFLSCWYDGFVFI
jgi:hypothetical protein